MHPTWNGVCDRNLGRTQSREPDIFFAFGRAVLCLLFHQIFAYSENLVEKKISFHAAEGEKAR